MNLSLAGNPSRRHFWRTLELPVAWKSGGLELGIVGEWYRAGENAFAEGVQIRLLRLAEEEDAGPTNTGENWTEVPPRSVAHFASNPAGELVGVGEELPAIEFDLRTLFGIAKPGAYRVELVGGEGHVRRQRAGDVRRLLLDPGRHPRSPAP